MRTLILAFTILSTHLLADLVIKNEYVRLVPPSAKNSAIFMEFHNKSNKDIKIVDAKSNIAKMTQIHRSQKVNNMMKMTRQKYVTVKANSQLNFKRGSYHVMLMGLKRPLKKEEKIKLQIVLGNGKIITINPKVKAK